VRAIDHFFTEHIPAHQGDAAFTSLRGLSDVVAICIEDAGQEKCHRLWFDEGRLCQGAPAEEAPIRTTFRMRAEIFTRIASGDLAPQAAFFTKRLAIEGDVLFGLQLGTLLGGFYRRHPWRPGVDSHV
jgi:hypothetical protein